MSSNDFIDKYIQEGYLLLNYSSLEDASVKAITLSEEQIYELLMKGFTNEVLTDEDVTLLVKTENKFHLSPLNLIDVFERLNKDEARDRINDILYYQALFSPSLGIEKAKESWKEDFFLEDPDHLVHFMINMYSENRFPDLKTPREAIDFIDDILCQKGKFISERKYKDKTLIILLCYIYYLLPGSMKDKVEIQNFYKTGIEQLASKNIPQAMVELGYNYYEGNNHCEIDFYKSEYWLKKAFEITNDPNLSRTLGYIYYYGRTNNGVAEGDKAFKFFSHAHFAGGYFEATYKLADCFLRGYGTIKSPIAAFKIVDSIIDENRRNYLESDDSKYADVALRKGSYYLNGTGCDIDYQKALFYLLEARDAIKIRMEYSYDPNDISVAFNISRRIEEAKEKLNLHTRAIVEKGYLLSNYNNYWSEFDIKIKKVKNNYYHVVIDINNSQHNVIGGDASIFYRERTDKIEYLIKFEIDPGKEILTREIASLEIEESVIVLTYADEDDVKFFYAEEIIYIPQHIKDLTKHVLLATVEFEPNGKTYEYYSSKVVKPGDLVKIKSNNVIKQVKVISTRYIYEDELPLPLKYMGKILFE